jgi:hypothetical protein
MDLDFLNLEPEAKNEKTHPIAGWAIPEETN